MTKLPSFALLPIITICALMMEDGVLQARPAFKTTLSTISGHRKKRSNKKDSRLNKHRGPGWGSLRSQKLPQRYEKRWYSHTRNALCFYITHLSPNI